MKEFLFTIIYTNTAYGIYLACLACATGALVASRLVFKMPEKGQKILTRCVSICAFAPMACALLTGYMGKYEMSVTMNILSLLMISVTSVCLILYDNSISLKNLIQLIICAGVFFIWVLAAYTSDDTIHIYPSMRFMWLTTSALLLASITFCMIKALKKKEDIILVARIQIKENLYMLPIITILVVTSVIVRHWPYIWDSSDYFQSVVEAARWEFTTGNIGHFSFAGHRSWGWSILTVPGVWIWSDWTKGIHIVVAAIMIVTVFFFGMIVKRILPKSTFIEKMLAVGIFAFSPAVLSQSSGYNLDYAILCFFVWTLCAWMYELDILFLVFSVLLCFSKEPSLVLYAGFVFGIYVCKFCLAQKKQKSVQNVFRCMSAKEWLLYTIAPILWVVTFVVGRMSNIGGWDRNLFNSGVNAVEETTANGMQLVKAQMFGFTGNLNMNIEPIISINHFGFNRGYVVTQMLHSFGTNFTWILSVVIAFTIAMFLRHRFSKAEVANNPYKEMCENAKYIIPLVSSMLFFVVFCCFYITHAHYRYVSPIITILVILFMYSVNVFDNKYMRLVLYGIVCVLMLVQNIKSIDPITNMMGYRTFTGKTDVYSFKLGMGLEDDHDIDDSISYNLEANEWGMVLTDTLGQLRKRYPGEQVLLVVPSPTGDWLYGALGGRVVSDGHGCNWDLIAQGFSAVNTKLIESYDFLTLSIPDEDIIWHDIERVSLYDRVCCLELPYAGLNGEDYKAFYDKFGWTIENNFLAEYGSWRMKVQILNCK